MPNLTSITHKLLSMWRVVFPPKGKEPEELRASMEKLPFPAVKFTDSGAVETSNTQFSNLVTPHRKTSWLNEKLWKDFCSGKTKSYEEQVKYGKRTFLFIGHINGIGPYCSVQDVTPMQKAQKLLELVSKGLK